MPTNIYFSQNVQSEKDLYEDLITESIKFYGQDVYYLPRQIVSRDNILDQVTNSSFSAAYLIEMYLETVDGFEGEGELFQKFGIEVRDQIKFVVSKRRWSRFVGMWQDASYVRPKEGDLIYFQMTKGLFEIKHVDHKSPFYQLSNVPVYKLTCELFEFSDEKFDTGEPEIDNIEFMNSQSLTMNVELLNNVQSFRVGELFSQIISNELTVIGEIFARTTIDKDLGIYQLEIGNIKNNSPQKEYHEFIVTDEDASPIGPLATTSTTNASFIIKEIVWIDNTSDVIDPTFNEDSQAQNQQFEKKADDIIDFSENNPFGDPSLNN